VSVASIAARAGQQRHRVRIEGGSPRKRVLFRNQDLCQDPTR
jgi:hypothetical protein